MIELDTIKELFKEAIDESDNMSEALQKLFDKVYDKGKEDTVLHGHWIKHRGYNSEGFGVDYSCSECDEWVKDKSKYCPNCGAKMESEDKE